MDRCVNVMRKADVHIETKKCDKRGGNMYVEPYVNICANAGEDMDVIKDPPIDVNMHVHVDVNMDVNMGVHVDV